jgi:RHS repeat-associated protein
VFYAIYDGNANIEAYLDSNGQTAAIYQYDAFGNVLSGGGKGAALDQAKFSHRFSTKYHDAETGLLYYGYRFYDPVVGRWINRDPIEENGGVNLYGFVGNEPSRGIDSFGLDRYVVDPSSGFLQSGDGGELTTNFPLHPYIVLRASRPVVNLELAIPAMKNWEQKNQAESLRIS